MRPDLDLNREALARWLAADGEEESDLALRELLSRLPALAPPPGFAERVMARALEEGAAAGAPAGFRRPARPWASAWLRAAVLLLVMSSASVLLWVPPVVRSISGFWSPAELAEKAIAGLMSLHLWLSSTFGVGQKLVLLYKGLSEPLTILPLGVVAAVCLLISAVAFRVLRALIHSGQEVGP